MILWFLLLKRAISTPAARDYSPCIVEDGGTVEIAASTGTYLGRVRRTRVSDSCPSPNPCPRFSDMPLSEPMSVSEVMTLSESVSESASEVEKNLVSVSEPKSEIEFFYLSESVSESMSELLSEPMSVSESEPLSESSDSFE